MLVLGSSVITEVQRHALHHRIELGLALALALVLVFGLGSRLALVL